MIEQVLIFALGFLSAGLASLLFLPAFWRRALRLSQRKLEMNMPLSMVEIIAERDQLRAEFAAQYRRLEQRLEALTVMRANEKTQLGERLVRISRLDDELQTANTELTSLQQALAELTRARDETQAEFATLSKELWDLEGLKARQQDELTTLKKEHRILGQNSDEQRTAIAGLETRMSSLELELSDTLHAHETAKTTIDELRAVNDSVAAERDQFRADARNANARIDNLQARIEQHIHRIEELETINRTLERDEKKHKAEIEALQHDISQMKADAEASRAKLNEQIETGRSKLTQSAGQIETLRAGSAALEGALATQRQENAELRKQIAQLDAAMQMIPQSKAANPGQTANREDIEILRKAIADVGGEMIRITDFLKTQSGIATGRAEDPKPALQNADMAEPMRALQKKAREAANSG